MVQLVAGIRHLDSADDPRIAPAFRIHVDHGDSVRLLPLRIEHRHVGQRFGLGLRCQAR
jgi:hypothetical protein